MLRGAEGEAAQIYFSIFGETGSGRPDREIWFLRPLPAAAARSPEWWLTAFIFCHTLLDS